MKSWRRSTHESPEISKFNFGLITNDTPIQKTRYLSPKSEDINLVIKTPSNSFTKPIQQKSSYSKKRKNVKKPSTKTASDDIKLLYNSKYTPSKNSIDPSIKLLECNPNFSIDKITAKEKIENKNNNLNRRSIISANAERKCN